MKYVIICIVFYSQIHRNLASDLGSACNEDKDCDANFSRCYQKLCQCLPFYAPYNATVCLQSNMLGFECIIPEQCSKKVANSTCIGGICRCEPGFLQFRRHTCLTAAKINEICYSDTHCRLWDPDSHCDYVIANLFGRCTCNAPLRQSRSGVCVRNIPPPSTSTVQSLDFPYPVIAKEDVTAEPIDKTTTNAVTKPPQSSTINNFKLPPTLQKIPTRIKPDFAKPSNKTDKPTASSSTSIHNDKTKPFHKPVFGRPDQRPPPFKPSPNKFNAKPAPTKRPLTKPEKTTIAAKKPDQKPPINATTVTFFNDTITQQKLDKFTSEANKIFEKLTSDANKLVTNFYQQSANTNLHRFTSTTASTTGKPFKSAANSTEKNKTTSNGDASTTKFPSTTAVTAVSSSSSFKPPKWTSNSNAYFTKPQSRPGQHRNDTLAGTQQQQSTVAPKNESTDTVSLSDDKILVVNNQSKKPLKNKPSSPVKAGVKNHFPTGFPSLASGGSNADESVSSRFPSTASNNVDKQVDTNSITKHHHQEHNGYATEKPNELSTTNPGHQRGADYSSEMAISLGYFCKTDLECMKSDNNSRCVNGICDCIARQTRLENSCSARNTGCHKGTFQCKSTGLCISWFFVCDGRKDCADGSDEDCKDRNVCPEHAFRCGYSTPAVCISQANRCDGTVDCANGEDERNCTATKYRGCPLHTFQCEDGRCLPEYEFCNAIISCEDGSDEPDTSCAATWNTSVRSLGYCPFRCSNGRCRSSAVVCSGRDGCGDNSDENRCSICKCPATH